MFVGDGRLGYLRRGGTLGKPSIFVLPVLVTVLWQNIAHAVGFLFQLLI